MIQGPDYIFAIQDKDFRFWRIDSTGGITCTAQPYFLDYSPIGWQEIEVDNVRNKKYWGAERSVSSSLSHIEDAAKILKYIFYSRGNEEEVYFVIAAQKLEYTAGVNYGFWYKKIFRGEIDLADFLHNGVKVTAKSLEEGLVKYLKSNENTVFELPMNVPEAVEVNMDGINLRENLNYSDIKEFEVSISASGTETIGGSIFIGKDGDSTNFSYQSENLENVTGQSFDTKKGNTNVLLENLSTTSITVRLTGVLEFDCTKMVSSPAFAFKVRFLRSTQLIANQNDYQVISTSAMVLGQRYTHAFDISIPLAAGEKLLRENIFFGGVGSDAGITFTENSKFSITFKTRYQSTVVKFLTSQYIFNELIKKATENNYTAALSAYFEKYKQKVFTCGNALRGFEDAVMKISLSDFFKDFDSFDSVGLEEQPLKKVGFDTKENLIDKVNIIQLPDPAYGSLKTFIAKDYLFNELEYGYPEIKDEIGLLNGKEEFNCKWLRSTGTSKTPSRLDKVSKIQASPYAIEKVRITTISKDTTDNKADNDLFSVYIEPNLGEQLLFTSTENYEITMSGSETILLTDIGFGNSLKTGYKISVDSAGPYTVKSLLQGVGVMNVYLIEHPATVSPTTGTLGVYGLIPSNLDRSLNPLVTAGLIEPETIFNLALSPARNLLRQGSFLRSCGFGNWDMKVLGYRTADRNNKLICDGVEEKADISISILNAPFFKPVILEADFEAPFDLLELLDNNPKQIYKFSIEGTDYFGLLLKVSTALSSNKLQSYQFLSDSNNDLTNLINYAG